MWPTTSDGEPTGTPIPCKKLEDSCEQSLSPMVHFCKTKAASGVECKATTDPEDNSLTGT